MTRYCSNCRAELPDDAVACPQCGVYAGDVFDGRLPRKKRNWTWLLVLVVLLGAGAVGVWFWPAKRTAAPPVEMPIRVVNRPGGARRAAGAKLSEPEAVRALRRHLTSESLTGDCLAISSQGWGGGAYRLTALNRCAGIRLGRFRVDANTGAVAPERQAQRRYP